MEFKDVEKARENYVAKIKKTIRINAIITVVISLIFALTTGEYALLAFVYVFFGAGIIVTFMTFIFTAQSIKKEHLAYKKAYKAYFVSKNLRSVFTNVKYNHELGLSRNVLSATQMVHIGSRYNSNDLTTGEYSGVPFAQADVHIEERHTDSDGNTTYVTIFKGRFMIFEFPKKFNFRLEVIEKGFGAASKVPKKDPSTGRKFEKIDLESSEFNKMFKTYAEDGFEAFYLLGPDFMSSILELGQEHNGKIMLGFLYNKLLIGLKDGNDAFEPPSVFTKLNEAAEAEKVAKDIRTITNFVDKLKLNRKLFK